MGSESPPRTRRRRALRGIAVALAVLAALGGYALVQGLKDADDTLDRQRALLARERETLKTLPRGRPALLEPARAGNAATVLDDFVTAVQRVPERKRLEDWTDGEPQPSAFEVVDRHPEVLSALEPILFVPSDPPPVDLGGALKGVARFSDSQLWLSLAAARGPRALHVALLGVAYGDEIARGGTAIHEILGMSRQGGALRRATSALARGGVDPDEAHDVGRALDALDRARLPFRQLLVVERAGVRAILVEAEHPENTIMGAGERDWDVVLSPGGWRRLLPTKIRVASALDAWDAGLDRMQTAIEGAGDDARETVRRCEAAGKDADPFVAPCLRIWPRLVTARANVCARLRTVRVALAVAEVTARRGTPPTSLEELVPAEFSAVPLDPWDGRPLRYRAGKVWSVGADGKDDGGTSPDADSDTAGDLFAVVPTLR